MPQRAMAEMECFANQTGEQRSSHRQYRNEVPDHDETFSFRLFDCSIAVSILFSGPRELCRPERR